jgi:phosphate transport system permease protein
MLGTIVTKGYTAFWQTNVTLPVTFDPAVIDPQNKRATDPSVLIKANYDKLAQNALAPSSASIPETRPTIAKLKGSCPTAPASSCATCVVADPSLIGKTVDVSMLASANIDSAFKGQIDLTVPEARRKVKDQQIVWMNQLAKGGALAQKDSTPACSPTARRAGLKRLASAWRSSARST